LQGLSLANQLLNEDVNPIDPNDDLISNSKMNDSKSDVDDDHELILQNEHMYVEDLMDERLDEFIQGGAPTQMVNLILQQQH
jgi:hypothetical protein